MYGEMQAVGSALTGLKTAFDLSKAFLDVKGAIDVQGKVFELQRVILTAQQDALKANEAQSQLIKKIEELEKELSALRTWGVEKENYQLWDVDEGSFAYVLKREVANGEPPHWLCAACFGAGKKSILQRVSRQGTKDVTFECPNCKSAIAVHWYVRPEKNQQPE